MSDKPLVSIVIPAKNSSATIRTCLKSIREQTYSSIEIIVVDGCSTDRTREIAKEYGAKVVEREAIRSAARNLGAGLSKGKHILSIDADMALTPDVVSECVAMSENGFDAIIIPELSVGEGFWARCKGLEKKFYIGDKTIEAARFFRREVFEAVEGYDNRLEAGEDWDINQRIKSEGFEIGRISAFIQHHEGKLSLRETMLKKRHYGKTLKRYRVKHPEEAKQQLRLIRPAFIRNWRTLTKDPVHASGMLFMKICEFMSVLLGSS